MVSLLLIRRKKEENPRINIAAEVSNIKRPKRKSLKAKTHINTRTKGGVKKRTKDYTAPENQKIKESPISIELGPDPSLGKRNSSK